MIIELVNCHSLACNRFTPFLRPLFHLTYRRSSISVNSLKGGKNDISAAGTTRQIFAKTYLIDGIAACISYTCRICLLQQLSIF